MPFIEKIKRAIVEKTGAWEQVGDLCYLHYLPIIRRWRENPRWTTAHNITKDTFKLTDDEAARLLAFLVFFALEVVPYEEKKRKENGEIN